jgi:hypothetical protein
MRLTLRLALTLSTMAAALFSASRAQAAGPAQPATPPPVFEVHLPPAPNGRSMTYHVPAPQAECDALHAAHPTLPRLVPCTRVVRLTIAPPIQGTGIGSPGSTTLTDRLTFHDQATACPFDRSWYCDSGVAQECGVYGCGAFGWYTDCYASWAYNYRAVWIQSFDNCAWTGASWPYSIQVNYKGYWGNGGLALNFGDGTTVCYGFFACQDHWMRLWVWDNDSTALQTDES